LIFFLNTGLYQLEYAKQRLQESDVVNLLLSKRDGKRRFTPKSIQKFGLILILDKNKNPQDGLRL